MIEGSPRMQKQVADMIPDGRKLLDLVLASPELRQVRGTEAAAPSDMAALFADSSELQVRCSPCLLCAGEASHMSAVVAEL